MAIHSNGSTTQLKLATFSNVLNGCLVETAETRYGLNPSTLEINPKVPVSTMKDIEQAVKFARCASLSWAEVRLAERRKAVIEFAAALHAHTDDFAAMLTREQGKPVILTL